MKIPSSLSGYMYGNIKDTYLNDNRVYAKNSETRVSSTPPPSTVVHLSDQLKSFLNQGVSNSASVFEASSQEVSSSENARNILDQVDTDPNYADYIAHSMGTNYDLQRVKLSPGKSPGQGVYKMSEEEQQYFQSGKYQQERDAFLQVAEQARSHRNAIYNEMKSLGASGKDIFYALMQYNNTLPDFYKEQAGIAAC